MFCVTHTQDGTIRRLAFGAQSEKTRLIDCFADENVAQKLGANRSIANNVTDMSEQGRPRRNSNGRGTK